MENALRATPLNIQEQREKQIKQLQGPNGEATLELSVPNNCSLC